MGVHRVEIEKKIVFAISMEVYREKKKIFNLPVFFPQHMKNSSLIFLRLCGSNDKLELHAHPYINARLKYKIQWLYM